MRAALPGLTLIIAIAGTATAATDVRRVEVDSAQSLQEQLLDLARERLQGSGVTIDSKRVWMTVSRELTGTTQFSARPLWTADALSLPLAFELQPVAPQKGHSPIHVTLGVTLMRDVWVATRRLRKGSSVSCDDLLTQPRRVQDLPQHALTGACDVAASAVSLRDIASGAVVRATDVGKAPDVMAGMPVRVNVATGGISITTDAVALADASIGDRIDVRLQRPARTLRTRVAGRGLVQLEEGLR